MKNLTGVNFSLPGLSVNKMVKIINGNKQQKGYKLALWNCGRGLLQCDGPGKLAEVKQFIESKRPHCFGIVEADLFGINALTNRKKYTSNEIKEKLKIDGYILELPFSWNTFGQARIICYVSEKNTYTRISLNDGNELQEKQIMLAN